jgi:hypothetical protein
VFLFHPKAFGSVTISTSDIRKLDSATTVPSSNFYISIYITVPRL